MVPVLPGAEKFTIVDIDDTLRQTYGYAKQGAGRGYTGINGHISMNWRGRPLTSHDVIVQSIAATTTRTGLSMHVELDTTTYPTGVKIPDTQMKALHDTGARTTTIGTRNGTTPQPTPRLSVSIIGKP